MMQQAWEMATKQLTNVLPGTHACGGGNGGGGGVVAVVLVVVFVVVVLQRHHLLAQLTEMPSVLSWAQKARWPRTDLSSHIHRG
jgi:hypothetical protein